MKSPICVFSSQTHPRSASTARLALLLGAALVLPIQHLQAQLQTDDFNDGNDAGWTRYDPFREAGLNGVMSWSFTNGGYRLRTTTKSPSPSGVGPGRGGSLRSEIYSDFYLAVDIVDWNNSLPQSAGLLARVQNAGLGSTAGYAFTWDRGNPNSATSGDVDISRITGESPAEVSVGGSDRIHLEPGSKYRMVFIGRGQNLEGRIYEHPDLVNPKLVVSGQDTDPQPYLSGVGGLVIYDNSTGSTNVCDITFDNFYASDIEPPRLHLQDLFFDSWELYWSTESTEFVLQSSTVLPGTPTDWTDLDVFPSGLDGIYRYGFTTNPDVEPGTPPKRFFRLVRRQPAR